jgi:polysaccharide biosynthesis protein PslE
MMEQNSQFRDPTNVRDILTIVFKHKYKILITFLVITVASVVMKPAIPPNKYEARAVLLVKFGRELLPRTEAGERAPAMTPQSIIATELQLVAGRSLVRDVIATMDPYRLYPDLAKESVTPQASVGAAEFHFREDFEARGVPGTSMIQVSYANSDPAIALRVVKELVERFKEKHLQVFSGGSTAFLEEQVGEYRQKLLAAEAAMSAFKERNSVISIDEQKTILFSQRTALETSLAGVQRLIKEIEYKMARAETTTASVTEVPADARAQLSALEQKERETLEKYNEQSQRVQSIRKDIAAVKQSIDQSIRTSQENLRRIETSKLREELGVLNIRADGIRKELDSTIGELRRLDGRSQDVQDLKRDIVSHENNYQTYLRRLEEARISDDMDRQKMVAISTIEEGTVGVRQTKMGKVVSLLVPMGLLGGLVAGFCLAFGLESLSPTMTTPTSAEKRLALPVMVAIEKK